MKKLIIAVFVVVVLFFGILFVINNKEKDDNDSSDMLIFKDNVEVYEKLKLSDVIELKNVALKEDFEIDTKKLGLNEIDFEYTDEGIEKTGKVKINVVDTTPPYIGIRDYYNHIIDTNFTFEKDVICGDNYDRDITCEIIGVYDLNTLGETNLKVVATDSSGNKEEKDFILRVIEKPADTAIVYKTLDEIKNAKPENASIMIDVSKWQAEIDWQEVKNAGIDYAMLRLGTQKAIDEDSVIDTYFDRNITEAQKVGIKVGVYYYSYANDINDAKVQAEWVIENLKEYKLDLPVAFDWECWNFFNGFKISFYDLNEIGRTFLTEIKNAGYKTLNYGSKNYMENIWSLDEFDVWLAHYTDETDYSKDYLMWQFTDRGIVPGIKNKVDVNYYFDK